MKFYNYVTNCINLKNNENIILYSYTVFIKDEEYKNYYNSVLKKLRIDKLNKICSNQVIK